VTSALAGALPRSVASADCDQDTVGMNAVAATADEINEASRRFLNRIGFLTMVPPSGFELLYGVES
jgi:hypothetical protein